MVSFVAQKTFNCRGPDKWHEAYDCRTGQNILFRVLPHLLPADNPQQAELASNVGVHGNCNCRECKVGGTDDDRETNEGYHAHFEVQSMTARTTEETIETIRQQIEAACLGQMDVVKELQTKTGVKDTIAIYWVETLVGMAKEKQKVISSDLKVQDRHLRGLKGTDREDMKDKIREEIKSLDPHRDTTVEILHTFLLGLIKYIFYETHKPWDKKKDHIFAARLHSSSTNGLSLLLQW
ncbi:hypothetical protein SISNIDRAFT_418742 [Sistotremastrum niveocremeum HHB9708]|uniref:Uncharacterized protein n=1 Tax=Sistotremastrum niveocremeum HHB9708 TaxID=1314777 RepID=A0A164NRV7_9AGAM|nr:hypothetical protein SISNIDRAFT_418742 [Sistotremastrum niveocremeum HHB9708]